MHMQISSLAAVGIVSVELKTSYFAAETNKMTINIPNFQVHTSTELSLSIQLQTSNYKKTKALENIQ